MSAITWELLGTEPGASVTDLPTEGWRPAEIPGTVALSLGTELDRGRTLDASDWWYRAEIPAGTLQFQGLATMAELYVDGELVATSQNMFRTVEVDTAGGVLHICFRSLDAALATRRPRPRWKTGLVRNQRLRWFRTSLVGRVPGWTPELPVIGPWRPVVVDPEPAPGPVQRPVVTFDEGRFAIDGQPTFMRGACWSAPDPHRVDGPKVEPILRQFAAAGGNLIRFGGTTVPPSDEMLALCDELGVWVWQDLMLANMDHPLDDDAFRAELEAEVVEQLQRAARHRCVVMICGGSEIAQQAAMLGLKDALHPWFLDRVPELIAEHCPGLPYVPSTPFGGPLPFHTGTGITHYFGVGAYRRPMSDVRRAGVRFATECLGFMNVPDESHEPPHTPEWKAGVSRDRSAGWDFQDVTDHYVRELFGDDPADVRYADADRYKALCRATTAELMLRTFAEWRRPASPCGGALVWLLTDLRPGAGCGLIDHSGRPKAALRALRRAWAPQAVLLTDEGLDGLGLHLHNESDEPLVATLELELLRSGHQRTGFVEHPVELAPNSATTLSADALLPAFSDLSYAYRFGPPRHQVVCARLVVGDRVVHQDVFFPLGHRLDRHDAEVQLELDGDTLSITTPRFLQAVTLEARGWLPDDDGFHLAPGRTRTVRFTPTTDSPKRLKVVMKALNLERVITARG